MKCAHLFTNERAPETDHALCSWWSAVLAWSQRCADGFVDKQRNKTNNISSAHQIGGKDQSDKRLRWTMERVRSTHRGPRAAHLFCTG